MFSLTKAPKPMDRKLIVLVGLIVLSGCAKLAHLQELLTLKTLSDNQTLQKKYIEEQNKKFQAILDVVNGNGLNDYPDKKSCRTAFGEPIFVKKVEKEGEKMEQWLYRPAREFFGAEKVYLYFDEAGALRGFKHTKPGKNQGNL